MSRPRLSFTERRRARRAQLAMKFGRLDQLEARTTMTEPISVTALALSSLSGLARLGIMQADGGNGGLLALTQAAHQARQGLSQSGSATAIPYRPATVPIGLPTAPAASAVVGGGSVLAAENQKPAASQGRTTDWLSQLLSSDSSSPPFQGITTPWRSAARGGGGAALPPRGGSGNGAQAITIALVAGRGGRPQAPPPSTGPATIPGYLASPPPASASGNSVPAPVVTRNAAASQLGQGGAGSSGSAAAAAGVPSSGSPGSPTIVAENPSSRPSSTAGNGSGFSQMSFPYFPLYVNDENNGIVLFNGQTQQASLNGVVDLYAQVQGTSVSTYSWTTSGLNIVSSSGASTYAFQFQLTGTLISARGRVGHAHGHQHQQPARERDILLRCTHDQRGQHAHERELADDDPARPRSLRRSLDPQPGRVRRRRFGRPQHQHRPAQLQSDRARALVDI